VPNYVCTFVNSLTARRITLILVVTFAALLLLQPLAFAQSQFATLSGEVRDPSGAVVSAAKVTVKGVNLGELRSYQTNDDGFFTIATLPAGSYDVTIEKAGFQKWAGKNIVLNGGDSRTMNITLKVGAVTDVVVVEASSIELAVTDTGEKSSLISEKDLQDIALVSRNASEYVKLLPGALLNPTSGKNQSAFSGLVVGINGFVPNGSNAGGLSAVNINGQAVNITMDGQSSFDPGAFGSATPVNPNPDMISEVKVMTSNFSAENTQGPVVVNTVTKGGGSEFHGSAYLSARNSDLNATDHFNKESATCSGGTCTYPEGFNPKPNSDYYYPGGNLGGPIFIPHTGFNSSHKKLFFFDGFEDYHQIVDAGVERAFVPDANMLNGDFSELLTTQLGAWKPTLGVVPTTPGDLTSSPYYAGMQYIAGARGPCTITGGVLGSSCVDPNAQLLMKDYLPKPNIPFDQINPANGFNFIANYTAPQISWQNVARVDWAISDFTKFYVSWSRQRESATMPYGLWNGACDNCVPAPSAVVGNNGSDLLTASFVKVFSPTLTSESRFAYTYITFPTTPSDPAALSRSGIGFPLTGIYGNPMAPALLSWSNSFPSMGDVGHDYHPTMIANKGIPSAGENLTKVIGTHTLKTGFYFQHVYNTQDNWGQYMGTISYNEWGTPTGNNYADALMGIGESYYEQALPPPTEIAQNTISGYVEDSWKTTRRLTLNLGIRLEHFGKPYAPVDNVGLATFFPGLYIPSSGPDANSGISWHKLDSAIPLSGATSTFVFPEPRLDAAYDLFGNGKTVIRGGWGMYRYYDSVQSNNYTGPAGTAFGSVAFSCNCSSWETIDLDKTTPPAGGGTSGLGPGLKTVSVYNPNDHEQPLIYQYNVTINQQLPAKLRLELTYAGNKGYDFQNQVNINYVPIGAMNQASVASNPDCTGTNNLTTQQCIQDYSTYPNYENTGGSGINDAETAGKSRFDALEASLKRSYSWVTFQANYTWSKTLAANQASGNSYFTAALPNYGTNWLYGISQQDRGQALSLVYVFFVPKVHGANSFVRGAVNGWQISGVTTIESGMQLSNGASGGRNFGLVQTGDGNQAANYLLGTPNITIFPSILCNPAHGLMKNYFANPSCFGPQPSNALGDASIPYLAGPMYWNSDLAVTKHFKIKEHQDVEFRASAFNFMNHGLLSFTNGDSNLQLVINDLGQVITGTTCPGTSGGVSCTQQTTFGEATHHVGNRVMELSVKFSF